MIKSTILEGQTAILSHPGYDYNPKTCFTKNKKKTKMFFMKFGGHEHACRPSISNQIGTNRIPMIQSIILTYQKNMVLTYPRVGIRAKY